MAAVWGGGGGGVFGGTATSAGGNFGGVGGATPAAGAAFGDGNPVAAPAPAFGQGPYAAAGPSPYERLGATGAAPPPAANGVPAAATGGEPAAWPEAAGSGSGGAGSMQTPPRSGGHAGPDASPFGEDGPTVPSKQRGRPRGNSRAGSAAAAAAAESAPLVPISHLGQYLMRWRIRARVTDKSGIRTFSNARGPGRLFSMEVSDGESGTRVTFFGAAVDKFYDAIVVNGVYDISGGHIRQGNPRYCPHPVEVTLDERSGVVTAVPDDGTIACIRFEFTTLAELSGKPARSTVDVMAVVSEVQEASTIQTRKGDSRRMRKATLRDQSGASCRLTLWGARADAELSVGSVVLLHRAMISDFGGISLDMSESGLMESNPDDARAFALVRWYQEHGHEPVQLALSGAADSGAGGGRRARQTLAECQQEDMCLRPASEVLGAPPGGEAGRAVNVHRLGGATVTAIPHDRPPFYLACTSPVTGLEGKERTCMKKVQNGVCTAGHQCPSPVARFNIRVQLSDPTSGATVGAFGEEAEALLGMSAQELHRLWERMGEGDTEAGRAYEDVFARALHNRWSLQLRSRLDQWEGQERVAMTVTECSRLDPCSAAREMLQDVRRAIAGG